MTWDVAEYGSAEEMIRAARQRRERWNERARPDTGINLKPPKPLPVFRVLPARRNEAAERAACVLRAANIASLRKMPVRVDNLRARRALRLICALHKVEPSEFYAPRARKKSVVNARTLMSRLLRKQGRSTTQIGRIMCRDHSTIVYHLNGKQKRRPKGQPIVPMGGVG